MWRYFFLFWCRLWIEVEAVRQHYVHWNTSNSLFFNTNIIDITSSATKSDQAQEAWDYEQANIICPLYDNQVPRTLTEQYVVYNVTKFEYDQCQLSSSANAKIVALCDTPYEPKFFTLTFRSFSPTPGAFEFHPGQKYYFISTNYLENSQGQRSKPKKCSHPPMKLIFRIKDDKFNTKNIDKQAEDDIDNVDNIGEPREMPMQTQIRGIKPISSSTISTVKHLSNLSRTTLLMTISMILLLCQ